jgi:hypothetical protein
MTNKKQQVVEMTERPSRKTRLGHALASYTDRSGNNFDEEFDKKIRELKPHWFDKPRNEQNKQQLLS